MATKDDRPTLFSKMAMFVRNPTRDWAELERPRQEQESGYDKQALKAMIERKRQNDFVRKREFDQLRKLRNRVPLAVKELPLPSLFQSSVPNDSDSRAVTLKKIDDIEAQMSKQWWKGKQEVVCTQPASQPVVKPFFAAAVRAKPADATSTQVPASLDHFEPTQFSTLPPAHPMPGIAHFFPNRRIASKAPMSAHLPLGGARAVTTPASIDATGSYFNSEVQFSTSRLFAIEVDEIATDPELEEAAIRFANGDDAGAESGLLDALRGDAILPDAALSWAAALLDLYRATHNRSHFDRAVAEFAALFDGFIPAWTPIGEVVALGQLSAYEAISDAIWVSPSELTVHALENLRALMASSPAPWHLGWSRLEHIGADAMPLLGGLFSSFCNAPVGLRFSGAERLVQILRDMMPSGDRSVPPGWWTVRLDALRAMHLQDECELAALDYCVTYEVSPPAWQEARCQYENVPGPTSVEVSALDASFSHVSAVAMLLGDARTGRSLELAGAVLGDASNALGQPDVASQSGDHVLVACQNLVRVDFSAAGSILNWVTVQQSEGFQVQFRDVNRLVAAFFNVIGINEHARVIARPM